MTPDFITNSAITVHNWAPAWNGMCIVSSRWYSDSMPDKNFTQTIHKTGHRGASAAALAEQVIAQTSSASATGIPTRVLVKTGAAASRSFVSAAGTSDREGRERSHRICTRPWRGNQLFDNAWDYHDGHSEEVWGRPGHGRPPQQDFLMTKNCERDYKDR